VKDTRIQKYMSDCGIMSRRAAEREIAEGLVIVNGLPAEIGVKIDPSCDVVEYKGKKITRNRKDGYTYIMLNKPCGYVTTLSDEQGRHCVAELVKDAGVRVYPVGRLDMYSEGLLLLTDDGALTERLTHPKHEIPKIYHIKLKGEILPEQMKILTSPMIIDDYEIRPVGCSVVNRIDGDTVLEMTLYEGRNRQIRKMCEQADLKILSLRRIAIGELKLGDLKRGEWRYLSKFQVEYLKGGKMPETKAERT